MTRRTLLNTLAAAAAPAFAASRRPPNVVLLFADDLGYGDLSCYGNPTVRTPHLDRMAQDGLRFTSFYAAASVCTPSRAGLLTGRYPVRAGQPTNLGPDSVGGLPLTEITLAQLLKSRQYRTGIIGKWHLGHSPVAQLPTHRGFDSYFGLPYSNDMIPPFVKTERPLYLYRDSEPIEKVDDQSAITERYTDEALRFIRSAGNNPFFLYLPYAMPHLPLAAAARFLGSSRAGLYGDVIQSLDWSAGEILRTLRERGLDQDTLVVFTSDNGPWLQPPSRMLQKGNELWHTGSKGLLRGHKGNTYEGGLRVPCIARWPGTVPAGQVSMDIASTLDLFPTVAHIANAPLPQDRTYDGMNLLPHLQGKGPSPRDSFYFFRSRTLEAVREGPWKLRFARDARPELGLGSPVTPELFHLDRDPAEQYDVYAANRAVGDRLLAKLRSFGAELKADLV